MGRFFGFAAVTVLAACLEGCGTYAPSMELSGDPNATAFLVNRVVNTVKCELREAVLKSVKFDLDNAAQQPDHKLHLDWLSNWGADVTLTLIVGEKSNIAPSIQYTNPLTAATAFIASGGFNVDSEATLTKKINFFLSFKKFITEFVKGSSHPLECAEPSGFQIEGDLKFEEMIRDVTLPLFLPDNVDPRPPSTFSEEEQFIFAFGGNATPTWKLVNTQVNAGGNFLTASRSRTNDVVVTLGPSDPKNPSKPSPQLENAHYQALLQSAFSNAIVSNR